MKTKEELSRLIPHAGNMCLLDMVEYWDTEKIVCSSLSYNNADNPLRNRGRLHSVCAVEYAAQAMAVHGGLYAVDTASGGFLASIRDLNILNPYMDQSSEPLRVEAEKIMSNESTLLYRFSVYIGGVELVNGRATVILQKIGNQE